MAGGLLNIAAVGNQNLFLTGNPKKTFFKFVYAKYTNFGLQKFRLDYEGSRNLNLNDKTNFSFKIKRYADLLMDTFLVVRLPHIWSPLYFNSQICKYIPYEFKWIDNLGTQMIDEITINCGGEIIQKFSGEYLTALVQRDFSETKKELYNRMTANTKEFNDPANYGNNNGNYPNVTFEKVNEGGAQPSIRGCNIYIPINVWFSLSSKMAFPLVSLQYNELEINVTIRPLRELFTIRDVNSESANSIDFEQLDLKNEKLNLDTYFPHVQPNFNKEEQQLYRFLQTPPNDNIIHYDNENCDDCPECSDCTKLIYTDKRTDWNVDIHLISTYAFLSEDERQSFASKEQSYLIKQIYEYKFPNVFESRKVKLDSLGLVSSWTFFFRRSDANLRNQWSNYTNWPYNKNPLTLDYIPIYAINNGPSCKNGGPNNCIYFDGYATGPYKSSYQKGILQTMAILLDGKYRENVLEEGVYNYIEKYTRTSGNAPDGLYCYNFCLQTNPFDLQPSGAINLSKFRNIELDFTTYSPNLDKNANFYQVCDPETNEPIAVNKPLWQLYEYTYDLQIFEERYNILKFMAGNCGLMYAR